MRYRKVRIMWLAVCGTTFILLALLCMRSYWRHDLVPLNVGQPTVYAVRSANGQLTILRSYDGERSAGQILALREELASDDVTPYVWQTTQINGRKRDALAIPLWNLVLLSAMLAAFSWARIAKQFSLRTLLLAMTLFAVLLGIATWAVSR